MQFAQLVKELRSEYGAAVTLAAERIATAVFSSGRSINGILQRHGLTGTPTIMQQQVSTLLAPSTELGHGWLNWLQHNLTNRRPCIRLATSEGGIFGFGVERAIAGRSTSGVHMLEASQ